MGTAWPSHDGVRVYEAVGDRCGATTCRRGEPVSPPLTFRGPWRPLVEHAGSVTALAIALQVSRSTLSRWIAGSDPGPFTRAWVANWAKDEGLKDPWGGK